MRHTSPRTAAVSHRIRKTSATAVLHPFSENDIFINSNGVCCVSRAVQAIHALCHKASPVRESTFSSGSDNNPEDSGKEIQVPFLINICNSKPFSKKIQIKFQKKVLFISYMKILHRMDLEEKHPEPKSRFILPKIKNPRLQAPP